MSILKSESFKYSADKSNPAVLGVLEGPCADIHDPTRNGRKYPESLWEKVFASPIVNEMLENGGIFGESQHPVDRQEVDTEKIAIAMKEKPIKKNNQLWGRFYILDTPCGRILKTLADFGYKIGISSRGTGEVSMDMDGNESVDPDSYEFTCFDAVLLPAVKAARMNLVTESLNNNKTLRVALNEAFDKATADERKVMEEVLNELDIDELKDDKTDKEVVEENKVASDSESLEVEDNKSVGNSEDELLASLQEALSNNNKLEEQITNLQKTLSVSYAKETKLTEELDKYKKAVVSLSDNCKELRKFENRVKVLEEKLTEKDLTINSGRRNLNESKTSNVVLNEKLNAKNNECTLLRERLDSLQESIELIKSEHSRKERTLNESIEELKKDFYLKENSYNSKIKKANALAEHYRKMAKEALNKYAESKAIQYGLEPEDILMKVSDKTSFSDVDDLCESYKSYNLSIKSLPFDVQKSKMSITESFEPMIENKDDIENDFIDSQLRRLANI